jgi:hypothetical protein
MKEFGIPMIVGLPGVAQNMQDQYEIGVVTLNRPLHDCRATSRGSEYGRKTVQITDAWP